MKKILLAEDDQFIADVYSVKLKNDGYDVAVAKDGQTALEKIKSNCPDLLFLDINLPKISGIELLKIIREDPKTKNLKVVIVSNLNPSNFIDDIRGLGVAKSLLKVETTAEDVSNVVKEILK